MYQLDSTDGSKSVKQNLGLLLAYHFIFSIINAFWLRSFLNIYVHDVLVWLRHVLLFILFIGIVLQLIAFIRVLLIVNLRDTKAKQSVSNKKAFYFLHITLM